MVKTFWKVQNLYPSNHRIPGRLVLEYIQYNLENNYGLH